MLPQFLLPETVARQDGASTELAVDSIGPKKLGKPLLVTLGITRIIERESLEVSIWGSPDGARWRELARFPQKYYCGTYPLTLDLSRQPDVRYLRAQWKMGRWGDSGPLCGFYLQVEDVKLRRAGAA